MCDIRVTLFEGDREVRSFENVTFVEVQDDSISVLSFFEAPQQFDNVRIEKIDCLQQRVLLRRIAPQKEDALNEHASHR
jgi:predicted RNA-binding protein